MKFYESIHCKSRAHCKTCRSRHGGSSFREGVGIGDADCPNGIAWDERSVKGMAIYVSEDGCREVFTLDQQIAMIKDECEKSPDNELWDTLKIQIKGVQQALEFHPENSPCWKKKQKIRVLQMYQKIKGGNCVKVEA